MAKYDVRGGFLPILVVSIALLVRKGALRHPCGSHTGPVRVQSDMKNIEDSRAGPVRAPHGVPVESCELFNQTISMQPCLAVRGP